ncbi:MAG: D-alanyl-D-alanine carboxypeptidase [Clostridia bacterium]|nr:D-alanyl-D-alanine carboxypeptidase [Clostridia bacterium]
MAKLNDEYEDIFSDSSFTEQSIKKKNCKKNSAVKFVIFGCIIALLGGGVGFAALSGVFEPQSVPTESSDVSKAKEEKTQESSEEEEEVSEESEGVSYNTTLQFKSDLNRFSKTVKKLLDQEITSEFVVLYDLTEDRVLYNKNGNKKCYPASTTKLMTAVVSSKILSKDTVITVGDEIHMIDPESTTAGLEEGMQLTYEMMLDAMLLPSGNDAAYTLAVNSARVYKEDDTLSNEEAIKVFAQLMNEAAEQLGCKGSHFTAPDGIHDDDHYTTAEDLTRIAAYARSLPLVMNSCKKNHAEWELISNGHESSDEEEEESEVSVGDNDSENLNIDSPLGFEYSDTVEWDNTNAMIIPDSGQYSKFADGMKTGFTDQAGTCVVSSATISGHTIIATVMNATTIYQKYHEANKLFEVGFKLYDMDYTHQDDYLE